MTRLVRRGLAVGIAALAYASNGAVLAHKTTVSPYTFYRDVAPILEARCGRCHGNESPSGLSLLRYDSARGATWRIRQMLVSNHMPPWFADGNFRAPAAVTARELNVVMTWATGGAPEGAAIAPAGAAIAPAAAPQASWPLGPPDQIVRMPSPVSVSADQADLVRDLSLPAVGFGGRMIRAVDLLPGTASLVRRAEILAKSGVTEQVLGLWQPGESPAILDANAAIRVPPNARLVLRMHYRRHDGDPSSDQSQVGLYYAPRTASPIETLEFRSEPGTPSVRRIAKPVRALAVRPISGPSGARVRIRAIAADGSTEDLAIILMQKDWQRRYVFATPVALAAGHTIVVSVIPSQGQLWESLTGEAPEPDGPIRIAIEYAK